MTSTEVSSQIFGGTYKFAEKVDKKTENMLQEFTKYSKRLAIWISINRLMYMIILSTGVDAMKRHRHPIQSFILVIL